MEFYIGDALTFENKYQMYMTDLTTISKVPTIKTYQFHTNHVTVLLEYINNYWNMLKHFL